ncbi:MAG: sigma 54-interacting transcriptional regulator [Thermoanaerobaculia bacterium]
MTTSTPLPAVEADFCLRGQVGGIDQAFPLQQESNRVGSLASNEVVLPRRGVSRHHASVQIDGRELVVEDLGSKNGTFINGLRIEQARMAVGGRVRFGPVDLVFDEYHRDDEELAIDFEPAVGDQTSVIPIFDPGGGGHWLRLAEAFHSRLFGARDGDIGAALRLLQQELSLHSACVQEIPDDGEAIVLAASGQVDREAAAELQRIVTAYLEDSSRQDAYFYTAPPSDTLPATTLAVLAVGRDPLLVALWGDFPGREKSEALLRLLARMVEPCRPASESPSAEHRLAGYPGLVVPSEYVYAQSAAMARIYELLQTLAQGDLPILITGETGVGKEFLAHILHDSSPRRRGPFVAINCAAIPAELLEAELFGIGDRVATGVAGSKGRLQMADGGSIFLDEIGDMSADLQAKLLRALQEKEVHPVGLEPIRIDVRVLAATNQELRRRISEGTFRADLYYRLAGYVLEIPPLRERPEDIPALVEHFLRDCARELDRPIRGLTVRALRQLTEYPWFGNVRELANEVRRAVYLCPHQGTIESATLSRHIHEFLAGVPPAVAGAAAAEPAFEEHRPQPLRIDARDESQHLPAPMGLGLDSLDLQQLEDQAVREALRRCRQNQVQAAKLLGISRQSLRRRMERMGELTPNPGSRRS